MTDRMRRFTGRSVATLALSIVAMTWAAAGAFAQGEEHGFGVKQYDAFHDVLHPLQHEALPNRDFKTIRARAPELYKRGEAIIKVGVPAGVQNAAEFRKEMAAFKLALRRFRADARRQSDTQLEASYSLVHDTFETLAAMLPRR